MYISTAEAKRAINALRFDYDGNLTESPTDLALATRLEQGSDSVDIFIVWDMNADSWTGIRTMKSLHQTLEGAEASIDDSIKTPTYIREPDKDYVRNFTYFAIEQRKVGA